MNVGKRGLKCRDVIGGFPGGLTVESFVETTGDDCLLPVSGQSDHVVVIKNRRLVRFRIKVTSECESAHLSYRDSGETWDANVQVNARPDKGGEAERIMRSTLDCAHVFIDEGIAMSVSYMAIGCKSSGSATMQLLLDAVD